MSFIIGVDTGGTYTDAVLMTADKGEVIATAKYPTTHHDLSIGTEKALRDLLCNQDVPPEKIIHIGLSSTLATNSVVENKGADVALLVIGYVRHFKLPVKAVVFIKGGHTITGAEEEPLEIEYLADIVQGLKNEVDAYGVCASMSIKNPTHELVAEKAISLIDPGKPVFCSHRASDIAGMQERAATAGLHAKLMPVMQDYVSSITATMEQLGLSCPLHIIAGNTSLVAPEEVVRFAGLTVASGPACTAHFGSTETEEDALIIDIGGTTTDIALVKNGQVEMSHEGCQIGGWHTHVEAVDMHTGGIGGDSFVQTEDDGKIKVGPIRVRPIALMDASHPALETWLGTGERSKLIVAQDTDFEGEIFSLLQKGPATPEAITQATRYSGVTLERELQKLTKVQAIAEYGFTPTDALHVLGKIELGDRELSLRAATILGAAQGLSAEAFAEKVLQETHEKIENLILDYVIQRFYGKSLTKFISERKSNPLLCANFSIKVPLIGIGAAARHLLPAVAEGLGTTVYFPENCEVGNAIGAALLVQRK